MIFKYSFYVLINVLLNSWAVKNGAIIDEETIRSKNEPLLGEQDAKGTWRIGDEVSDFNL